MLGLQLFGSSQSSAKKGEALRSRGKGFKVIWECARFQGSRLTRSTFKSLIFPA